MRNDYIIGLEKELDSLIDENSEFKYVGKDNIKVLVDKGASHSVRGLRIRLSGSSDRYLQVEQCLSFGGKKTTSVFGRNILGLKKGDSSVVCDHINRNPLDNRRCNLRPSSKTKNSRNRLDLNKSSGYRHVYVSKEGYVKIGFTFRSRRIDGAERYQVSLGKGFNLSGAAILADCINMLYDSEFCLTNFDKEMYSPKFIDIYLNAHGVDKGELMAVINKSLAFD